MHIYDATNPQGFFCQSKADVKYNYNIAKAKRTLWLANSASTICPWMYAADVLNNGSKARAL